MVQDYFVCRLVLTIFAISVVLTNAENLLPNEDVCGKSRDYDNRVKGGSKTALDDFPWTAYIMFRTPSGIEDQCGGFLISKRYVLSAAHCFPKGVTDIVVRLGEYDIRTDEDCLYDVETNMYECAPPPMDIPPEEIIVHENYFKSPSRLSPNDIALIRLIAEVPFSKFVRPICLQMGRMTKSYLPVVAGWGYTEYGEKSNVKLKAETPFDDIQKCMAKYSTEYVDIHPRLQLCAGDQKHDACNADSGGALMIKNFNLEKEETRWSAVGIVSFGVQCEPRGNEEKLYGVYTNVSAYIPWIVSRMKP